MVRWAYKFNCITFNVNYQLAPEAKTPRGQKEFAQVFNHVYENAEHYDVDNTKIVIAGDDGGGFICLGAAF